MDAPVADPPAAIAQPTHPFAATENYGRTERERALCERAAAPAWGYVALWANLFGASLAVGSATKYLSDAGVRMIGPGFIGLAWGGFMGSIWPAAPKCHPYFVGGAPPEGGGVSSVPIALLVATIAGSTAPIMVGVDTGSLPATWTTEERVGRLFLAGGVGFFSALLPYVPLLAPRTWRAALELEKLRLEPAPNGAVVGWATRF